MITASILSQNRIGRRLFLQSLIIAAGLTILFSGLQVWLNYQDELSTVQKTIRQIDQVQMRGISTALWYFSMPELRAQIEGITNFPYISYAEVQDNGRILSFAGVKKSQSIQETEIPITYLDNGSLNKIGVLYIQVDTGAILADHRAQVIRIFLFQAVNIWISLFFFLLLVDRQVTRHLNAAARYLRTLNVNNYHAPLKLDKKPAADEIDALVDAFNQMQKDLFQVSEQRANLLRQTEQRLMRLVGLRKIDTAINSHENLSVICNLLLEQVMQLLSVDAAQILLLDPNSNTYHFQVGQGFHTQGFAQISGPIGARSADKAVLQRATICCCDIHANPPDPVTLDKMMQEGFEAFFAVPLVTKDDVKGILQVFYKSPFTPAADWIEFLETLAGQAAIATGQAHLLRDLQRSNWELRMAYDQTIEGWSTALDLRDRETEGHSQRVCAITLKLAELLGLQGEDLVNIRRGALLHDIGKMGVPDHILLKPGKLTAEEWSVMYKHPDYAYQLLSPIEYLHPALDIPYCHHEKWDGSGYPRHLKGDEIPLAARIFAVVDVWDALTSNRPYRERLSDAEVLQYLREHSGKHFDPEIVKLFIQVNPASAG